MADEWIEAMLLGGTTDRAELRRRVSSTPPGDGERRQAKPDAPDNRSWCAECGDYEGTTDLYPCEQCDDLFCSDCESLHVARHSREYRPR